MSRPPEYDAKATTELRELCESVYTAVIDESLVSFPDLRPLLTAGADPNVKLDITQNFGDGPDYPIQVMTAALSVDGINALMDHGANMMALDSMERTVFSHCVNPLNLKGGCEVWQRLAWSDTQQAVLKTLLERGFDPNKTTNFVGFQDANKHNPQVTPMAIALHMSPALLKAIQLLLQYGASPHEIIRRQNITLEPTYPVCMLASVAELPAKREVESLECIDALFAAMAPNSRKRAIHEATFEAGICGNVFIVKHLIDKYGAVVDAHFYGGQSILAGAITNNASARDLAELVELGCDVNEVDYRGQTPLQHAVAMNAREQFIALIECGADLSKPFVHRGFDGKHTEFKLEDMFGDENDAQNDPQGEFPSEEMAGVVRAVLARHKLQSYRKPG